MRAACLYQQQYRGQKCQCGREQLRDPQRGARDIQTVCPQALDPGAADAVPEKVKQRSLSVVAAAAFPLPNDQSDQTDEVPQALIQESRVHADTAAVRCGELHAAEDIRLRAEGFAVHEVAPAADDLSDQKAEDEHVEHRLPGDLLFSADRQHRQHACDHAAVNGQPSVPDRHDLIRMGQIIIGLESNEIQSRADDRKRDEPDDQIVDVILADAEALRMLRAPGNAEQKADRDDHAVEIDVPAEQREIRRRIDRQVAEQPGKRDRRRALNGLDDRFHLLSPFPASRRTARCAPA